MRATLPPSAVLRRFLILRALRSLPTGLFLPFLVLIPRARGLDLADVGLIVAAYGGAVLLLELPTGGLADALGRRPVLVLAAIAELASTAALLAATDLPLFLVGFALGGVGRALRTGPLEAWYVDQTLATDRSADVGVGFARGGLVEAWALGAGALLAGVLPLAFPGLPASGDALLTTLTVPLVASGVAAALNLAAVLALVTADAGGRRGVRALAAGVAEVPVVLRAGVGLALRSVTLRSLLLAYGAHGLALAAVETLWQPRMAALAGGAAENTPLFGTLMAAAFAASGAGSGLAPRLIRRVGGRLVRAAGVAAVAGGASTVLLAAAGNLPLAVACFVLTYLLFGMLDPPHEQLLHANVESRERATVVSANSLTFQLGGIGSSLTLPALAAAAGIPVAWVVAGVLMALGAIAYLGVSEPSGSPASPHARAGARPPVGPVDEVPSTARDDA